MKYVRDDIEHSIPGDQQLLTVHEIPKYDGIEHHVPKWDIITIHGPVKLGPSTIIQGPTQSYAYKPT